ncbi:Hypothetical predicted protein [Olea europaea subsp. europaea]|uniref:Uncharacterized protein n=1 Tax=Olea europaea subsp. europaea TaxID=158383 RepID=A0A8S0R3D4_OLEEU|nr:Hypothetical predicted protein [Olea europaea subsp. europaea]
MQDNRDDRFLEVLHHNYGKPLNKSSWDGQAQIEHRIWEKKTSNEVNASVGDKYQNDTKDAPVKKVSPVSDKPIKPHVHPQMKAPAKETDASRGKNKNFFTKLFGLAHNK